MRIVVALGGNALGNTLAEQMEAVKRTSKTIADLIEDGHEVVLSHGNGPQAGMIQEAMDFYKSISGEEIPLTVSVAMSQGYIGYDLQNALQAELAKRDVKKSVTTLVTQVKVDPNDPAFQTPTKPIGHFLTPEDIETCEKLEIPIMEDAGRGFRKVVASPKPKAIVEIGAIRTLLDAGEIVIACGGGGIPVYENGGQLKGIPSVIDKDFASCVLAQNINADLLIILTAVERVAIRYGTPEQVNLDTLTPAQARSYMAEGHFAPGSMLPKVQAAVDFVESGPGRTSLITLLKKAKDGIEGKTGTRIVSEQ